MGAISRAGEQTSHLHPLPAVLLSLPRTLHTPQLPRPRERGGKGAPPDRCHQQPRDRQFLLQEVHTVVRRPTERQVVCPLSRGRANLRKTSCVPFIERPGESEKDKLCALYREAGRI